MNKKIVIASLVLMGATSCAVSSAPHTNMTNPAQQRYSSWPSEFASHDLSQAQAAVEHDLANPPIHDPGSFAAHLAQFDTALTAAQNVPPLSTTGLAPVWANLIQQVKNEWGRWLVAEENYDHAVHAWPGTTISLATVNTFASIADAEHTKLADAVRNL